MTFKDHFSPLAASYASFRPTYPPGLFDWLAGLTPHHKLAWDCAAGSGQATFGLARHFERVVATDASAAQIAAAVTHSNVEYRVAPAEQSGLPDHSANLIAAAQALHWFELERFYLEAKRVLAPGGMLAAWCYGVHRVEGAGIDAVLQHFYTETVGPYWPPERRLVETGYRTLPFPFAEIPAPAFEMQMSWTLAELLGYLRSWSATGRFIAERGHDPVEMLEHELLPLWGDPAECHGVSWPLSFRIGKTP